MTAADTAGHAIFLNGGSSAGKSTIGRSLQSTLDGDWLLIGVDVLIWLLPVELVGDPSGISVIDGQIRRGPRFLRAYGAFAQAVAALCRAGQNVIVDDVLVDAVTDQRRWATSLAGTDVVWVAVRCAPEVATSREAERGDRPAGVAGRNAERVHRGVEYDIDVDTSHLSVDEAVATIVDALPARWNVAAREKKGAEEGLPPRSAWGRDGNRSLAPWER
jgi:chloramphenicol 3-O phosphotransferase